MIVEPIMMGIGIVEPPPGYLQAAHDLLRQHGALMTLDEVEDRVHRGARRRQRGDGPQPDLICLAKSLGGGLPCGAIGGTRDVMSLIADGAYEQVGTFQRQSADADGDAGHVGRGPDAPMPIGTSRGCAACWSACARRCCVATASSATSISCGAQG